MKKREMEKRKPIDVSEALAILKDSVLKIDDLLPLFPEEAKVEEMK
jgi:vacuolar protein sorting-associated protein 18